MYHKITTESIIEMFHKVHGDYYDYSRVLYNNARAEVTIICPKHGEFNQTPGAHKVGKGCYKCSLIRRGLKRRSTLQDFIEKSNEVHNNKYDYTLTDYQGDKVDVKITCPIHGVFTQRPGNHVQGKGCNDCANLKRFQKYYDRPTILYFVYFTESDLYKIGITSKTLEERFISEPVFKILFTKQFPDGETAYNEEQYIIRKYSSYKYIGKPILNSGNSELFTRNILNIKENNENIYNN